ncbi:MAG: hypothetical protein KIT84_05630 [Labilithrix sp.]|nr:hypothetical protein [Labilithrix sp.]MCW5810469.1 hypothetical protein [Labilithrix sp.]
MVATTAEALFRDVFLPLYPEDARSDLGRARSTDANPAKNPYILAQLDDAARIFVELAETALGVTNLALDFSDASVHRLGAAIGPAARERLRERDELFNFVIHGALYVGACVVKNHGATWAVRRPLWESLVHLKSRAGEGDLPVFHWWLKSLSDEGTATLGDRYRAHVEVPCLRPEELPIIAAPEGRTFARLSKIRYDVFYKYLKAHLPEVKDVGAAFPSPERFTDYGLAHLDFALVGGGRMLLVHGPNKDGLHAFWLTKEGFEKAAFWPADKFPAPFIKPKGDKLEVHLSKDGQARSFELLWWGP